MLHIQGYITPQPEKALSKLLEKAFEQGQRGWIWCPTMEKTEEWDKFLWQYAQLSFLPHGLVSEGGDLEAHPFLIGLPDKLPGSQSWQERPFLVITPGVGFNHSLQWALIHLNLSRIAMAWHEDDPLGLSEMDHWCNEGLSLGIQVKKNLWRQVQGQWTPYKA